MTRGPQRGAGACAARLSGVGAWVAVGLAVLLASAVARADDPGACGPFAATAVAGGATASAAAEAGDAASTATLLLVLPRTPDGGLGEEDLVLRPDARVADSFWSPVLCATVARIVGPPGADPDALVTRLPAGAAVAPDTVYTAVGPAEPRPLPRGTSGSADGGDPYRDLQHALDALEPERARPVTDGRGVRIGLVDSRPAPDHPDLPAMSPVGPFEAARPGRHGTLLAGVLAAPEDNGVGIVGLAPGATLVALPACAPAADPAAPDRCRLFDLLRAFDAAWEARTAVLNLSLVGAANPLLERAVARLDRLGMLVVAAAGNEPASPGPPAAYPAAYPAVIGVGAVDARGDPWPAGDAGGAVEIRAPGVEIVSTVPDGFAFADGTSLAAAHVSGVLALLASASGDLGQARAALFQAGHAHPGAEARAARLAPVCDALARLGRPCPDR
ncbi:MAG: S8 family serine peptidase [Myxococcota bacterium]|nr:S8 family serine peptidase [Myxococcota bacterium]